MDSSHRDRIKEIQKRKEEREKEAKKKRIFLNRCIVAAAAVAVIFLIVFGIKSCAVSMAEKRAEKEAQKQAELEAAMQEETAAPQVIYTDGEVNQAFYANSVFIGNSFIDGMEIYDLVDNADYFARVGLTVKDAMTLSTANGSVAVVNELNKNKAYSKIFVMFGENELGWINTETFKSYYEVFIETVRDYQPNAQIYLLAVTPITQKASDASKDGITNENVVKFNRIILELAKEKNVNFADIYSAVVGEDGVLPDNAASDGIHFGEEYYKKCLVYIQEAFK